MQGVHKGLVVEDIVAESGQRPLVVAIGDDDTDEDLFASLSPGDVSVRVGGGETRAGLRFSGQADVITFLRLLVGP
jgi:trehalose 6-phosphate synthase/phosphatase